MSDSGLELLTIAEAAAWAKVGEDVIRRWIADGMKATPTGSVGKRGPRNYLIFRAWVIEWLEELAARERRRLTAIRHAEGTEKKPRRSRLAESSDNPLGPPPRAKAKA